MSLPPARTDILAQLRRSLADRFSLTGEQLQEDMRLRDLKVDSMHVVEIMLDLEEAFGARFSSLSLPRDPTLGAVADAMTAALSA